MAIGGLISNRSFGSFIDSGKFYPKEKGSGGKLCTSKYAWCNIPCQQVYRQRAHCPSFHVITLSNGINSGTMRMLHGEQRSLLLSHKNRESDRVIAFWQRRKRCCSPSLNASYNSWHELGPSKLLATTCGKVHKGELDKVHKVRAFYKSEQYDIAEAKMEALTPPEASTDVFMVDVTAKEASPWWEQFPKRWVIVLLCFSVFLLCNMDRVNMSIAILPMSQEFGWNSATVGLIQSSCMFASTSFRINHWRDLG